MSSLAASHHSSASTADIRHCLNQNQPEHHHASNHHTISPWLIGTIGVLGAVILAPYALPLLGIGDASDAESIMHGIGGHATKATETTTENMGSGAAGAIARTISSIPVIGSMLFSDTPITLPGLGWVVSSGSIATIAFTSGISLGGVALSKWLETKEEKQPASGVAWSKLVRYAALSTSMLVALPSILSGISVGVAFLSMAMGGYNAANHAILALRDTLGATSMSDATMSGASALFGTTLPHLFSCGGAFFLSVLPFLSAGSDASTQAKPLMNIEPQTPLKADTPCTIRIKLTHNNKPLGEDALAVTHTKKLHLMLIDDNLKDFQHVHPQPTSKPGEFIASFTPHTNHNYSGWADFTTTIDQQSHQIKSTIGLPTAEKTTPSLDYNTKAQVAGVYAEWSGTLKHDDENTIHITLKDEKGTILRNLDPIMGAYAHLVGFYEDGSGMVHAHPTSATPKNSAQQGEGNLEFHIHPEKIAAIQFFLQIHHQGNDVYIPFAQVVEKAQHTQQHYAANKPPESARVRTQDSLIERYSTLYSNPSHAMAR